MNTEKIERLLNKYFEGESSLEEEELLRNYFRSDKVAEHLKSYRDQFNYTSEFKEFEADKDFDPLERIRFEQADQKTEKAGGKASGNVDLKDRSGRQLVSGSENNTLLWSLRIAAGIILLLVGFSAGLIVSQQEQLSGEQVAALQEEVKQMKQVLIYGSDHRATASERISAVRFTEQLPERSGSLVSEITEILIYTLNNDENINVREAAAEALFRFRAEPKIRRALVSALGRQEDPLMQLTLINMLVELKEASAINEMQKLLMNSETRDLVKTRLEVGIAELKT